MATNRVYKRGDYLAVVPTDPTLPLTGMAVRYGQRPGVCEVSAASAGGTASISFVGVYNISVKGFATGGTGASAVAVGDILYYADSGGTAAGTLDKNSANVRFGYAMGTVASGGTGTIAVALGY